MDKLCPIYKNGDASNGQNYRPISPLSIGSKIMEREVYHNIIPFILPLISKHQFGFLQKGNALQNCWLHFTFDSDSIHQELLHKLWRIDIAGQLWKWFRTYYWLDRIHYISIMDVSSNLLPHYFLVPQDSIIGPLLFLMNINDLPTKITYSIPFIFADDTTLIKAVHYISVALSKMASTPFTSDVVNGMILSKKINV